MQDLGGVTEVITSIFVGTNSIALLVFVFRAGRFAQKIDQQEIRIKQLESHNTGNTLASLAAMLDALSSRVSEMKDDLGLELRDVKEKVERLSSVAAMMGRRSGGGS